MTKLTDNLYAVEVEADAKNFIIDDGDLVYQINFHSKNGSNFYNICAIHITSGNWRIIGTVTNDSIDFDCDFIGTKDGFRALMYSKGLDLTKKYVIIKSK